MRVSFPWIEAKIRPTHPPTRAGWHGAFKSRWLMTRPRKPGVSQRAVVENHCSIYERPVFCSITQLGGVFNPHARAG